jgi:hypothetical protein
MLNVKGRPPAADCGLVPGVAIGNLAESGEKRRKRRSNKDTVTLRR